MGRRLTLFSPAARRVLLLLITALAFALRLYALDGQSMWSDEGLSLFRSRLSLGEIFSSRLVFDGVTTVDTNPPFYFLLLHLWRILVGESVFLLRYLSVTAGVLSVPLLEALARRAFAGRAFGRQVGILAAFLLAISPFHIWQSQEMRNYSLLLFLNFFSVFMLLCFLWPAAGEKRRRRLFLWLGSSLLAAATHYFGFFVFAFGLLVLIGYWLIGHWTAGLRPITQLPNNSITFFKNHPWLLAALLLTGLTLLPLLRVALARFRAGQQVDFVPVPLLDVLSHAASVYAVGIVPGVVQPWWRTVPVVMLVLVGLGLAWRRRPAAALFLLGYQLVPLAILLLLSTINPLYNGPRHLLIGLPPFLVFAAAGLALLPRRPWAGLLLGLLLAGSQLQWLQQQFMSPDLVKDDVRGAALYLNRAARPADLIIVHDVLIGPTFDYYYEGEAEWRAVPAFGQFSVEESTIDLEAAAADGRRIWFLSEPTPRNGHPRRLLPEWAAGHWARVTGRRFPSLWLPVQLELFVPQPYATMSPDARSADTTWAEALQLTGFELPATAGQGGPWWPVFYWQKEADFGGSYFLSLRFVDDLGEEWLQYDWPLWENFPPAEWQSEKAVFYPHEVNLPAGMPPGDYWVTLRVLDENGRPLPIEGERVALELGRMTVLPRPLPANERQPLLPEAYTPLKRHFGGEIDLLGYYLLEEEYRPGHLLEVDVYWQVRRPPEGDYRLRLQLVGPDGFMTAFNDSPPTRADYPSGRWPAGHVLHGRAGLTLPADLPAGSYRLELALMDEDGQPLTARRPGLPWGQSELALGQVEVVSWPLETEVPPVQVPLTAEFGQPAAVRLQGYDLSAGELHAGQDLRLNLVWRAQRPLTRSYIVFVHLAGEDDLNVAQGDSLPVYGFRPTTSWRENEVIVDEHLLSLAPDVPPGTYFLWVGFFDPDSGRRLPVTVDGAAQAGDRLLITTIEVLP